MLIQKDDKKMNVSPKAFRLFYKEQGYVEAVETAETVEGQEESEELRKMKVGTKTSMACDDNTKIYKFYMEDGNTISIEIECDWFVIDGERYQIIKD